MDQPFSAHDATHLTTTCGNRNTYHAIDDKTHAPRAPSACHNDVLTTQQQQQQRSSPLLEHKTTAWQTFVHLLKGNIGPGMLSLPWAFSVLESMPLAFTAVMVLAFWSTYNCWTIVRIKRYMEETEDYNNHEEKERKQRLRRDLQTEGSTITSDQDNDDTRDENMSEVGAASLRSGATSNITYPDVGEWAYGKTFHSYVSACICVQQLAICTVFISFIGENLMAVLAKLTGQPVWWATHAGVMTMAMPCCLFISFIPSLKGLAPVVGTATFFLFVTLALLVVVGLKLWPDRTTQSIAKNEADHSPFLALCAILYSFEGICLVLPTESAMQNSRSDFGNTFFCAMTVVACLLAGFSAACVAAFGDVTNGSVTAFLLRKYADGRNNEEHDESLQWLLLLANTVISFSVLLTYPLQLFPAVELFAPSWSRYVMGTSQSDHLLPFDEEEAEKDLTGFEQLPSLPEHERYEEFQDEPGEVLMHKYDADITCIKDFTLPSHSQNNLTINPILKRGSSMGAQSEEASSVQSFFSSAISFPIMMSPKMILPGDSIQLRAALVLLTYSIAVVVPNVESLISLAGALSGSATALLIPPLLELAWISNLEKGRNGPNPNPSLPLAKQRSLLAEAALQPGRYTGAKLKCYFLFFIGLCFMLVGTWASLVDIVAVYSSPK